MKRLPQEIDEKTKFKKRKKGTTLGGFVTLDGQVKYEPGQAVTSVKHKIEGEQVRTCSLKVILNLFNSNNCHCPRSRIPPQLEDHHASQVHKLHLL